MTRDRLDSISLEGKGARVSDTDLHRLLQVLLDEQHAQSSPLQVPRLESESRGLAIGVRALGGGVLRAPTGGAILPVRCAPVSGE